MDNEIILADISPNQVPEALTNDRYYVGNAECARKETEIKEEIYAIAKDMDPLEVEFSRRYAGGETVNALQKTLKKTRRDLNQFLETARVVRLIGYFQHLNLYMEGPNQIIRRNMLYRIAVDNEKLDPKETIKAISELNKMDQSARGTSSSDINIVINNETMPRGNLDG
jgi:hypothetical protein